jgi:DNA-binding transcriptional ArsR family regulator
MRPLYHPPMSQVTVHGILFGLSDPVRVRIFAELVQGEGRNCAAFVNVNDMPLPKSSLSQHFKVLRECGLIRSERNGVELKNYTRCDELKKKYGKLIQTILKAYRQEE